MQSSIFIELYTEGKFWLSIGGIFFGIYKVIDWFKSLKTNDLAHIQSGVNDLNTKIDHQTVQICDELKGLRSELRTYFAPMRAKRK